jgi:hypothetical protein
MQASAPVLVSVPIRFGGWQWKQERSGIPIHVVMGFNNQKQDLMRVFQFKPSIIS